ncbi:CDP-glycerol glycerophosphotransferase family protein [Microbacterium sp. SYP-A9085]|uniref:bifunctional glycosyltransferase/CDP-glycerol:glycerophosphate glycerophosphotransferase n=1 Tax=Microbacterium sp. SYP-A9085 TaxID=2664454 RepID=UPI001562DA58|nr:CDP-glycerol glycerophosphotransferase family protein [Microbacterium sp. SYP-A9085]
MPEESPDRRRIAVAPFRIAGRWIRHIVRSIGLLLRIPGARRGLLSIVVPVYNVEKYVRGAVRSLLDQDYRNIEIIIVDDGSPDASMQIVRSIQWRNPAIRIVRQANAGLGAARNTGARHARGEFLTFLDSDDKINPWAYTSAIGTLNRTGSDFAVAPYSRLDGSVVRAAGAWIYEAHEREQHRATLDSHPEILVNMVAWSKVYRREFWTRTGLDFPEGVLYEDQATSTRAYAAAKSFDILSEPGVLWRIRGDRTSISQQYTETRNVRDHLQAALDSLRALADAGFTQAYAVRVGQLLANDYSHPLPELPSFTAEAWQNLKAAIDTLFDAADSIDRTSIPARSKVLYSLIRQGRRRDAERFLALGGWEEHRVPSVVDDGRVYADLPFFADPDSGVPQDEFERCTFDTRLRSAVTRAEWTADGTLDLTLWASITNLDSDPLTVTADLVGSTLPIRIPLTVTRRPDPLSGIRMSTPNVDATAHHFDVVIDATSLPRVPTTYSILITATAAGVARTRLLHLGAPPATTGALSLAPLLTAELHADRRGYATLDVVAWAGAVTGMTRRGRVLTLAVDAPPSVGDIQLIDDESRNSRVLATGEIVRSAPGARTGTATITLPRLKRHPRPQACRLELGRDDDRLPVLAPGAPHRYDAVSFDKPVTLVQNDAGRLWMAPSDAGTSRRSLIPAGNAIVWRRKQAVGCTDVTVTGDTLVIDIRGADDVEGAVLEQAGVHIAAEITRDGAVHRLAFPLHRDPWRTGSLRPWSTGDWTLHLMVARGDEVVLEAARGLLARMPLVLEGADATYAPQVRTGTLVVTVAPRLSVHELNPFHQEQLRRRYRGATAPLRHAVLFRNLYGDSANDTSKAVHEQLRAQGTDLELLWAVKGLDVVLPEGATPILEGSAEYWDAFARAKYVMVNVHQPDWFEKKPGQVVIQTFHGYPFKLAGRRHWQKTRLPRRRVDSFYRRALEWDYLLSPAPYATPLLAEFLPTDLGWQGEFLEIGYPRNDVLLSADGVDIRNRTRARLGVADDQKVVLYAPTYRDYLSRGEFRAEATKLLDVDALAHTLGPDYTIISRGHVMNARAGATTVVGNAGIDATAYPDVNDLILASDAAVVDYSSLRFDYALTDKPMLFLNPDRDRYFDGRDPMVPYEPTAPGPWLSSTSDVARSLASDEAVGGRYATERERFRSLYMPLEDGHATERLIDRVFRVRGDA